MSARFGAARFGATAFADWGAGAGALAGAATLSGVPVIGAVAGGALAGRATFAGAALLAHVGTTGTGAITVALADAPLGSLVVSDST